MGVGEGEGIGVWAAKTKSTHVQINAHGCQRTLKLLFVCNHVVTLYTLSGMFAPTGSAEALRWFPFSQTWKLVVDI